MRGRARAPIGRNSTSVFNLLLNRLRLTGMLAGEEIYDEQTFRHFLSVERRRAEQTKRALLLVLVSVRNGSSTPEQMPRRVVRPLLATLARSVREVDFVGWYDEDVTVGAVLTQRGRPSPEVADAITARLATALATQLPSAIAARLDIRVTHALRTPRAN